eukprot:5698701-Alexandrium_andersonii.AAC.1
MSASLVGSEMCIRDSPMGPQATLARAISLAEGRAGCMIDASLSGESVSYTHLTLPTICSV